MKSITALVLTGVVRVSLLVALCALLGETSGQVGARASASDAWKTLWPGSWSTELARVRPLYDWEELPLTSESPGPDVEVARSTDPLYDWEELPGRSQVSDP